MPTTKKTVTKTKTKTKAKSTKEELPPKGSAKYKSLVLSGQIKDPDALD